MLSLESKSEGGSLKILYSLPTPNWSRKNAVFVNWAFYKLSKASGKDGVFETHVSCSYNKEGSFGSLKIMKILQKYSE